GTVYDATGCILIATSNLGYKEAIERFNLFKLTPEQMRDIQPQVENYVLDFIEKYFSPEFRGRFGREFVIFFNHFSKQDYEAIVSMQVDALKQEMAGRGLEVTWDAKVNEGLAQHAIEARSEGARQGR